MTDWNEVAGNAQEKTDKELAAGLDKLLSANTAALFPLSANKEKVDALIAKIKSATSYNEKVAVFKAVSLTLGKDVLDVVKKAMLAIIVLFMAYSGASAQAKTLDLSNPLADPRLGIAFSFQGNSMSVAYVPMVYWMPGGDEYATLNIGASNNNDNGKKSYLVSVGPRLDILLWKLSEISAIKKSFQFVKLPPLQISPSVLTTDFKRFYWWVTIASKFGGSAQ